MSYVRRLKKFESKQLDRETLDEAEAFARLLGYALIEARKAKFLRQEEIARVLGLSQSTYAKIEGGRISITVWQLLQVSRKLEAPLSGLIPPP